MGLQQLAPGIASELRAMAEATERLAVVLCEDERFVLNYLPLLQQFDLLAQQQAQLAALLLRLGEGMGGDQALAAVKLSSLADRIRRAN